MLVTESSITTLRHNDMVMSNGLTARSLTNRRVPFEKGNDGMMEVWKNEIIEAGINGIMEIQFAYMEG